MKKMTTEFSPSFKNILFVIGMLFFTSNISASNPKPFVKIGSAENKVFTLHIDDVKLTNITIRIFDEQGANLLKEEIAISSNFSKSYDLSNLPKGIYEVELEDEISFRKYFVMSTYSDLKILEDNEEKLFKPFIRLDEKLVLINMFNSRKENVEVEITNEIGEEFYSERIKNTLTIHKGFDLSKLPAGKYFVTVMTHDKFFKTELELKK